MTTINGTPIHALSVEQIEQTTKEIKALVQKRKNRALNNGPDYLLMAAAAKKDYNRLLSIRDEDRCSSYIYDYLRKENKNRVQFLDRQEWYGKKIQQAQNEGFHLIKLIPTKAKGENAYFLAPKHLCDSTARRMAARLWLEEQGLNSDKYTTWDNVVRRENEGAVKATIVEENVSLERAQTIFRCKAAPYLARYGDQSKPILTGLLQG